MFEDTRASSFSVDRRPFITQGITPQNGEVLLPKTFSLFQTRICDSRYPILDI